MPVIADHNLGIDPKSAAYGVLYACFGLGAALGAITVGTVFAQRAKSRLLRPGFIAFAVLLAVFGLLQTAGPAFAIGPLLGYSYFIVITSLSTVLQERLDDTQRGRVMALWIMGFGGMVPVGVLLASWVADVTSITAVIVIGSIFSVVLALWSSPSTLRRKGAWDV
jgi:MFS family permease